MHWQTRRFRIDLSRPRVMGIVNATPDSFSDGGRHDEARGAIAHCERLVAEGADILDIGGESTRPGAPHVDAASEWARIDKVLAAALTLGVPVSVDTYKPEVMRRALDAGADIVNDVQALQMPGALAAVAGSGAGVCLMHMRGEPASMMDLACYGDVVAEVAAFLARRAQAARDAGIAADCIALDPGYGFAKKAEHNLRLLAGQRRLAELGHPLLVGWSRKRTLGDITGRPVDQRLPASLAAALRAVSAGANVLRVHDVAATVDALKVWAAVDAATIPAIE
ncbi:dihydropteroate synthase [Roseateles saccharophilus]|uniref:Dihydropteroate synthase n=1 Tax=Roseateles saccharophilus TaxID=304 RepID=A0A4R3UMW9_ROSSA|nr:dihydropteroate synthase [Roseateles saccharophilus]MDG0834154.1 dihydropteroate synthase [Roseateles saccharophilus]TCU91324.1 dihydropteroate synthase [Roseateles saccharophilus]